MPALFVFTLTSEQKMLHRMGEVAEETEHAIRSVEWADQEHRKKAMEADVELQQKAQELRHMYRQSILQSGVRVVETPTLQWYHQGANYVQANPFKVILGIGIPAIVGIFYGKSGKEHCTYSLCIGSLSLWHCYGLSHVCIFLPASSLEITVSLQMMILHTRVLGQFSVVCTLLGVMGLKDMMDKQGKFITESQVDERVLEMESTRAKLLERLEYQANHMPEYMKKTAHHRITKQQ